MEEITHEILDLALRGLCDLSSPTGDWIRAAAVRMPDRNH